MSELRTLPKAAMFGGGHEVGKTLPGVRAHETVPVSVDKPLDFYCMRNAVQADHQKIVEITEDLAQRRRDAVRARRAGEFRVDHEAEAFSFRAITDMPAVRRMLDFPIEVRKPRGDGEGMRAITTSAFPLLTSALAVEDVNAAYEAVPTVSELLIGEEFDDPQPNTELAAILDFGHTENAIDLPKDMVELEKFREIGGGEERYTILSLLDGFYRSFSQTFMDRAPAQVFNQLSQLGEHARELIEIRSLLKITDYYGSKASSQHFHAMIRNRSAASLFSTTANTPSTRTPSGTEIQNNALVDESDIENLRSRLAGMRNPRGFPIMNKPRVVLVPDALWTTAWKILNAEMVAGVFNEPNFFGPGGPLSLMLVSTPYLDLLSTSAWYGGDPRKIFVRKWALRPEVATHAGAGTAAYVDAREAMRVRIGWDMDVGVRDHVGWVRCLSGTTAPADE